MRNKKGFTLIELLAIIVILAIIAVITVPIILNIIDNAEKGSVEDSALGYKDALQKYYATKSVQNPEQELPSGYMEISELPSDFTVSGENPSDGWVKLKNGIVEKYSLKYKDYVVSMDSDKNVISEKKEKIEPHVTNDYQEVEYLESTGTQYINTGYLPKQDDYLELKNVTRKSEGALFSAGTGDYQLIYLNIGSNNYFKNFATGTAANFQLGKFNNSNIKVDNNNLYINDELYATSVASGDANTNLRLFARANDLNYISAQVGNVIIKSNDIIVRNLVPVIRKSDNKPGMLDLANYSENLWSYFPNNVTRYGVTFTSDGKKIVLNGTATDSFNIEIKISLSAGIYTLKANANRVPIDESTYCIQVYKPDAVLSGVTNKNAVNGTSTFTLSEDTDNIAIRIRAAKGANYDGFEIIPTLNKGSEALSYETFGYKFYTNEGTGEFIAGPEI